MKNTPLVLCLIISVVIIVCEGFLMIIFHKLNTPHQHVVLLDSLFLIIMISPVLYLYVYKPLNKQVDEIKTLRGIIPICSYCHQIRDEQGGWNRLEAYILDHSHEDAAFSHGICPDCKKKVMADILKDD